jgi:hypothetical protein
MISNDGLEKWEIMQLKSISVAQLTQMIDEMVARGDTLRAHLWVLWLKNNRRDAFDLLPKTLQDLAPDVTIP